MKLQQFADVLQIHASMLEEAGAQARASDLLKLVAGLRQLGDAKWPKLCANALANLAAATDGPPNDTGSLVGSLLPQLDLACRYHAASGSKGTADYAFVIGLVKTIATVPIDRFVAAVQPPSTAKSITVKKVSKPKVASLSQLETEKLARELADRLTAASKDHGLFEQTLSEIKAGAASKELISKIANRFRGTSQKFDSIKKAYDLIRERHMLDLRDESAGRIIDRIAS